MADERQENERGEVLLRITKRGIDFTYVAFVLRLKGDPATTKEIASRFKDCSTQLATSALHGAMKAGALTREDNGEWRPTEGGLSAMRVHFHGWSDKFTADDEQKALATHAH